MPMAKLLDLLKEGRYQFDRYPMIAGATLTCSVNSVCDIIQNRLHWNQAATTERQRDPIFIIGHWRTGTTFLQYLLGLDDRSVRRTRSSACCPSSSSSPAGFSRGCCRVPVGVRWTTFPWGGTNRRKKSSHFAREAQHLCFGTSLSQTSRTYIPIR